MAIIEEFPPFKLCALCKGILPSADDPNVDDNIQSQIWTNDEGYYFTRTREEVERGAIESCEFCTDIVQNDKAYKKNRSPDRQNETIDQEEDHERGADESDEESEQESEVGSHSAGPDEGPDYITMFSGPRAGQYCALSDCWGGDQVHKTTHEKYAAYLQELPYEELPQTIRDAFQVARSVAVRYIWIDSLCIVQDEKEDVAWEMAKMFQIYFNSCFTISAASALTCRDGFLKRLSANDTGLFFLPIRVDKSTKGSVLMSKEGPYWAMIGAYPQPMNDRAWTLQEAMLTPRLLIFTGMDVIWKCQAGFGPATAEHPRTANEIHIENLYGPPNESRWFPALVDCGYNFISIRSNEGRVSRPGDDFEVLQEQWCLLVENYTKRNLTVATDKLPSISAIARLLAPKLKTRQLYLLKGIFHFCRNWLCDTWASVQGTIEYVGRRLVDSAAEAISCSVDLAYTQDPFGAVTGGVLEIWGHLTQISKEDLHREHGRIDYKRTPLVSPQTFAAVGGNNPQRSGA
ncbi:hypothetical protein LRP88_02469 [Fusarium phalaenopsidis]